MDRKTIDKAMCLEMHSAIAEAIDAFMAQLSDKSESLDCSYPPGVALTDQERNALRQLSLSADALSAIRKLALDACAYPTFRLFSVMDGVGDPVTETADGKPFFEGTWRGLSFCEKNQIAHRVFLHDLFYETTPDEMRK